MSAAMLPVFCLNYSKEIMIMIKKSHYREGERAESAGRTCAEGGLPPGMRLRTVAAAVLCLSSFPSMAQQVSQDSEKNVFTLGTVQVYGKSQTAAEEAESVVERETLEMLEKKDVGAALKLIPGVSYNSPGGGRHESGVYVRGYDLKAVPIYMDGIPVYIPYDGYSDLGRFTTADVSSIQVAKGYSSVLYGHNTQGGVINIVSLRPRSELDLNATLGTATGNVTEFSTNVGTLQDKWYLQAGVSHFERRYTKLAENFVGTDARGNDVDSDRYDYKTRDRRGSIRIGYIPNATDEYVLSYAKQSAVKMPGSGGDDRVVPTVWEWPSWDRETVSFVSNTRFWNDQFYVKPRVYYDKFQNTMDYWQGRPNGSHYDDKAFGASLEVGTEIIRNHQIKAMISFKDEEHRSFDTSLATGATLPGSDQKVQQEFLSLALEDTWTINDHWEAQIGAIYTKRKSDATDIGPVTQDLLDRYPAAGSRLSPSIDTFDPQLAIFYKPSDAHTFRASVAKKTRFPSFKESYSNYAAGPTTRCPGGATGCTPGTEVGALTLQNPGMKPEQSMHYELGYVGHPLPGMRLEGSVFYSRSKNTFQRSDYDFDTYPGFAVRQYENISGITERKGVDLGLQYSASPRLLLGVNYAYLHMRNKEDRDLKFTSRPSHLGMVYAQWRTTNWLTVIPEVEYRSSSYYDSKGENENPGYAVTNLRFSITPPAWKHVSINVGAENLFNRDYRGYNATYSSPGRVVYANLRIDYH